jgi:hypothetical protein
MGKVLYVRLEVTTSRSRNTTQMMVISVGHLFLLFPMLHVVHAREYCSSMTPHYNIPHSLRSFICEGKYLRLCDGENVTL